MVERAPRSNPETTGYEERFERLGADADVHGSAWGQTLEDMHALADERASEGWDVIELVSGSTGAAGRDSNAPDDEIGRFGITYVVPGEEGRRLREVAEDGDFPVYDVYRGEASGRVFLVTELRDPDRAVAVFLAGNVHRHAAQPLVEAAVESGRLYSHVRTLDGTHLATFEHEGYEKFFPEADRVVDAD